MSRIENAVYGISDGWSLNRSIENSSVITGGKAAYVGTVVGRWVDLMVRIYRSPIDCSSFRAEIESRVIN